MLDKYNYTETESGRTDTLVQALDKIERLEKQLNKQGEQFLTMIDLLQKSYFYLSAAKDCKLTLEHCGNIEILCDLIDKCFKELEK